MKKITSLSLIACVLLLCLAACGGSPSSAATSAPEAASSVAAVSTAPSVAQSTSAPLDASLLDMDATLAELATAANLGGTIKVSEIDLKAGGVDVSNIEAFAGAESQLSAQNGGIVLIIKAVSGTGETVAADLESFRDFRLGNADYEEFEDARTNTTEARIEVFGDYVVYAVSATGIEGGWDVLDTAIAAAFA